MDEKHYKLDEYLTEIGMCRDIKINIVVGSGSSSCVEERGVGGKREKENNIMVYENSFSRRQMESLMAISDTFLPSIDVSRLTADESLVKFYATSASMAATPQRVSYFFFFLI